MVEKPKEVSKIEREMKRLVAKMEAESTALNKILEILKPLKGDDVSVLQSQKDKHESEENPNNHINH